MPETLHLDAADPQAICRAAELLRSGKLVAFPTETVYGLGANAFSAEAVAGIFTAKQRPSWDPLIVHIAGFSQLGSVAQIPADLAVRVKQLAAAFWPGPLTLLLPRAAAVPDSVTAGRALVGVRVPAHPIAHELLRQAGIPIAAPSANTFGHTSPTTAAHVLADLAGRIDAVLDGGPTTVGVESTVLDPATMTLYRPGAITAEQLEQVTGVDVTVFQPRPTEVAPESLPSPGVGIRHYAPRARLLLLEPLESNPTETLLQKVSVSGHKVGVLRPSGWLFPPQAEPYEWGSWTAPETLAARLFAGLRNLDDHGVDIILAPLPPKGGLSDALRDRLEKAAREK
jgi:L-threonylcarbamoyladenylate synthase